jgi:hypothetical protein
MFVASANGDIDPQEETLVEVLILLIFSLLGLAYVLTTMVAIMKMQKARDAPATHVRVSVSAFKDMVVGRPGK